jgi:hypothetical protein
MAAQSGAGPRLTGARQRPQPHTPRERRRRRIGPVIETLEGRLLLAGTSPTNTVPIGPKPDGTPSLAGVAYQQVVAVQTTTLKSLGDSYREVQAAGAKFASRAVVAFDQLNAVLRERQSQHEADAITAAIGRDHDLLALGGADAAREEQGLDVARGLADQQANTDEVDIINGLYTKLADLVQQNRSTDAAISRSGQRSENALVRELNRLGNRLTSTIPTLTSVSLRALVAMTDSSTRNGGLGHHRDARFQLEVVLEAVVVPVTLKLADHVVAGREHYIRVNFFVAVHKHLRYQSFVARR